MFIKKGLRHAITGAKATNDVSEREKSGSNLDGTVLTEKEILYNYKFKHLYVPIEEIVWAYLQVAQSQLMRGQKGTINEYRVLFKTKDGDGMMIFSNDANAKAVLKHIEKKNEKAAIGFTAENKARFGV